MKRPIAISLSPNTFKSDYLLSLKLLFSPWEYFNSLHIKVLEQWFRNYFNISYAISFNSGRSALLSIIKAIDVGPDDEVLMQAFTCVVVPNAVIAVGAKPVYVDIQKDLTMNPLEIEKKITNKTKAIIVQHTFGIPSSMDKILLIAKKNKLRVIEDVAHTIGAEYQGKKLGSFADAAFFSFGRDKAFSSVFGGIAITDKEDIGKKIRTYQRSLQKPSFLWTVQQLLHPIAFSVILPLYNFLAIGKIVLFILQKLYLLSFPVSLDERKSNTHSLSIKKMPNQLAALAMHQLKHLKEFNGKRQKISKLYQDEIKEFTSIHTGDVPLLRFPLVSDTRDELFQYFKKSGILLGTWYADIIDPKGTDFHNVFYEVGSCPKTELISKQIINLPTYPAMTIADAHAVITHLKKYANRKKN